MKVLIPSILEPASIEATDVELAVYDPHAPIPREHYDADVFAAWVFRPDALADAAPHMDRLRLVQALSAGTDAVEAAGFPAGVPICSGVGLHDETVSEHALALVLAQLRGIAPAVHAAAAHRWATELAARQDGDRASMPVTTLSGARVLIWGFGSIGRTLAPHLVALGAEVVGAARTAGERDGIRVVDEEGVDAELAAADIVVMILPGTAATRHALNAERLALMKTRAYVVNVGRGSTADPTALLAAVRSGRIAGAALDVTEPEPLPADSPLWAEPNILITPHIAGTRPRGAEALLSRNIAALRTGAPLENLVRG